MLTSRAPVRRHSRQEGIARPVRSRDPPNGYFGASAQPVRNRRTHAVGVAPTICTGFAPPARSFAPISHDRTTMQGGGGAVTGPAKPPGTSFGQRRECMSESGRQGGDPGRDRGPRARQPSSRGARRQRRRGRAPWRRWRARNRWGPVPCGQSEHPIMRLVRCRLRGACIPSRETGLASGARSRAADIREPGPALTRHPKT